MTEIQQILERADRELEVMCRDCVDRIALRLVELDGEELIECIIGATSMFRQTFSEAFPRSSPAVRTWAATRFANGLARKLHALRSASRPDGSVGRA